MEKRDTYTGRKDYFLEYAKRNLKRVPLDLPKEQYEKLKEVAKESGESINGYIKKAIEERMNQG